MAASTILFVVSLEVSPVVAQSEIIFARVSLVPPKCPHITLQRGGAIRTLHLPFCRLVPLCQAAFIRGFSLDAHATVVQIDPVAVRRYLNYFAFNMNTRQKPFGITYLEGVTDVRRDRAETGSGRPRIALKSQRKWTISADIRNLNVV